MEILVKGVGFIMLITFMAFFGAIIVWAAWDVIFAVCPSAKGFIAQDISLWNAFKLSWLALILIKSTSSSSSQLNR